jgi:hypothetical protein
VTFKERIGLWLLRRKIVAASGLHGKDKRMFAGFLRNWQTSLIGCVMAAVQLHQGGMSWQNAAIAALMAALGLAAKDSNVTGGTKVQPS